MSLDGHDKLPASHFETFWLDFLAIFSLRHSAHSDHIWQRCREWIFSMCSLHGRAVNFPHKHCYYAAEEVLIHPQSLLCVFSLYWFTLLCSLGHNSRAALARMTQIQFFHDSMLNAVAPWWTPYTSRLQVITLQGRKHARGGGVYISCIVLATWIYFSVCAFCCIERALKST